LAILIKIPIAAELRGTRKEENYFFSVLEKDSFLFPCIFNLSWELSSQ